MKLPKVLKIGMHEYKVVFPFIFSSADDCLGEAEISNNELRVAGQFAGVDRPDSKIVKTLFHEIIHVIDSLSGHHVFQGVDDKWNEDAIETWSEWLCMLFIDNPELLEIFYPKKKKIKGEIK